MNLLIRYGIRTGAVTGVIYYSNQVNLWGDSEQATELYKKVYQFAAPYVSSVKKEIPLPEVQLPTTDCASRTLKNYWNKGVVKSVEFIGEFPSFVTHLGCKTYVYINKQLENANSGETN